MKNAIKALLQGILGYRTYLRFFAWFKVKTLHSDKRERDFFVFLSMLPENGIVLDIGANLGFLVAHVAQKVKKGEVIAFEPMPDNLDALRYVIRKFKLTNVRVEGFALGDHNGEVEMVLPVQGKARQQGLSHIVHEELTDHNEGIRFKVPLRTVDSLEYLFVDGAKVTGIKMDVENFEKYVLAGAEKLIQQHQPIVYLELWENDNRAVCFDLFKKWSYQIMISIDGRLVTYDPTIHHKRINFTMVPSASL